MENKLWYNPNCSKSIEAKRILDEANVNYIIKDYINEKLDLEELEILINILKNDIELLIREEANISVEERNQLSIKEIINIILENPEIMQRPIYQTKFTAKIVRPPELIKDLIK
jgi:arsenate reductase